MPHRPPLHLLVGYVPAPAGYAAIELATTLAAARPAEVTLATVVATDPLGTPVLHPDLTGPLVQEVEAHLDAVAGRLSSAVSVNLETLAAGSPAAGLDELARTARADLLVLGETHRPHSADPPRDTASRLLAGAPCALAIAPVNYVPPRAVERVGVAFDGSAESRRALEFALRIAGPGIEVRLIAVLDRPRLHDLARRAEVGPDEFEPIARNQLTASLRDAAAALPADVTGSTDLIDGDPAPALAAATERDGIDVLVVGSRGYGPEGGVALGSVAHQLVTRPACPTVVVPRGIPAGG